MQTLVAMKLRLVICGLIATAAACSSGGNGNGGTAGASATGSAGSGGEAGTSGLAGSGGTVGDAGSGGAAIGGSGGAIGGSGGGLGGSGGTLPIPACTPSYGGSGGTVGSTAGTAGGAGTGAAGGAIAPPPPIEIAELAISGSNSQLITTSTSAPVAVTVTAIDGCATVTCPSPVSAQAQRFTLTGATDTWALYLRNSRMPADYIKVGDAFDLTIAAATDATLYSTVNQTVVLARAGQPIVFAANLYKFYTLAVPALDAFNIQIRDQYAFCQDPPLAGCIPRPHFMNVTVSNNPEGRYLRPGEGVDVHGFSFTSGRFTELADTGNCDTKSQTTVAGFKLP
jgi:hypothetical protein